MKKTVALILGTAMAIASVAGLAACGKKRGAADVSRRPDPREADAYEVYDYLGEKVGAYKTIGLAINAAVEADKDFTEDAETPDGAKGGAMSSARAPTSISST